MFISCNTKYHFSSSVKMSTNILFQYTQETIELNLKFLGKTQESLDKDIDVIIEWLKTQPHLPEIPSKLNLKLD